MKSSSRTRFALAGGSALGALAILLAAFVPPAPSRAQTNAAPPAVAIFAGGCFWCMEPPFDKLDGVISTTSGYTGGAKADPTYSEVSAGTTGHYEAIRVEYDPARVSYEKLLDVFWHNIDPVDSKGQFCDKGPQYRSVIFPLDDRQRTLAEASKAALAKSGVPHGAIATAIIPASVFYPAEAYHQDYYLKNPTKYKFYRWNCGRDSRLKDVWGDAAGH